jgi:hypothetical protein
MYIFILPLVVLFNQVSNRVLLVLKNAANIPQEIKPRRLASDLMNSEYFACC